MAQLPTDLLSHGDLLVRRGQTRIVIGTRAVAREIVARFGGISRRVCCYFPGYPVTDDGIAALVAAIKSEDRSATP